MSSRPLPGAARGSLLASLAVQLRVIGALMMRELHTRYGRENIGYLWLIGEPLMLATVIASIHLGGHTEFGSDMKPLPFAVLGYTTYIVFRGIVNRAEGGLEANAPLLYHRMVTIFDLIAARALLEVAGVFLAFVVLLALLIGVGLASLPYRPLYLIAAYGLIWWWAWANSMVITAVTHENRTAGRLVGPYSYFMIPLSASFYQIEWIPHPYREYLLWLPMPHIFELARYGMFRAAPSKYFDVQYVVAACLIATLLGLMLMKQARSRVHLS